MQVNTWTQGDAMSRAALMPWHKKGQILIGRNPDGFADPTFAFDEAGRLICNRIMPVRQGVYECLEGGRAKPRRTARRRGLPWRRQPFPDIGGWSRTF